MVSGVQKNWAASEGQAQAVSTFGLANVTTLRDGVRDITKMLGLAPIDGTDVVPEGKSKHILYLSGVYIDLGGIDLVARVRMKQSKSGVGMELTVRSNNQQLSEVLSKIAFSS